MRPFFPYLTLALVFLALQACSTTQLPETTARYTPKALDADYYQVRIPTRDGKRLAATVYQPALPAGHNAPLIIATHGFAGFRAKRPISLYGKAVLTGEAALAAWRAGYWVLFYDQRGWGQSEGKVHMMDPEYEVDDLSQVIDWALSHLPGVKKMADGSPAIGMIGESYGAGLQTLASFTEPRLKALVPLSGWHDMNSLAPNGEFRSGWGAIMLSAGGINSGFDIGAVFSRPWNSAFDGTISREMQQTLYQRSPARFCDQHKSPHADALFIQGFSDTVFPFQEAEKNVECWRRQGKDARLIAMESGHVMPWPIQKWRGFLPFYQTDDRIHCGDFEVRAVDAIVSWWDEKLRDGERRVPRFCLNVTRHRGLAMQQDELPASRKFRLPKSRLTIPLAGAFEWLMVPFDTGGDLLRSLWPGADLRALKANGGWFRPKFIPLYIARGDDEIMLGEPRVDVRIAGTSSSKRVPLFVGIGIQHANQRRVRVASEQLTPLPEKGLYRMPLAAISQPLEAGDRVGLVVYGFTSQFPLNSALLARSATIKGDVWLPLTRESRIVLPPERPY